MVTGIANLPDNIYQHIAEYLKPPEIYSFNKAFPEQANSHAFKQAPPNSVYNDSTTIGQFCLHQSQLKSLIRSIQLTSPLFTPEKAKELADSIKRINEKPQNSLLLSGSTLVQATTGLEFLHPKDLDLYTNLSALQESRNMLKEMGFLCYKVLTSYYSPERPFLLGTDPLIHHVEIYVSDTNPDTGTKRPSTTAHRIKQHYSNWLDLENGWMHPMSPSQSHRGNNLTQLREYQFCPSFPFTETVGNIPKIVDLVVLNPSASPQDVLRRFDLDICKAYFDGSNFGNIQEENTYFYKSDWDPNWQVLVNSYVLAFLAECREHVRKFPEDKPSLYVFNIDKNNLKHLLLVVSSIAKATKNNHWQFPCPYHGFDCNCTIHLLNRDYLICLHKRIVKQFKRALKYIHRGISIPSMDDALIAIYTVSDFEKRMIYLEEYPLPPPANRHQEIENYRKRTRS